VLPPSATPTPPPSAPVKTGKQAAEPVWVFDSTFTADNRNSIGAALQNKIGSRSILPLTESQALSALAPKIYFAYPEGDPKFTLTKDLEKIYNATIYKEGDPAPPANSFCFNIVVVHTRLTANPEKVRAIHDAFNGNAVLVRLHDQGVNRDQPADEFVSSICGQPYRPITASYYTEMTNTGINDTVTQVEMIEPGLPRLRPQMDAAIEAAKACVQVVRENRTCFYVVRHGSGRFETTSLDKKILEQLKQRYSTVVPIAFSRGDPNTQARVSSPLTDGTEVITIYWDNTMLSDAHNEAAYKRIGSFYN
jgi:hypothetical protein